jgi:hypothetical protein
MSREERRQARYVAAYTERYGKAPQATPEYVPTRRTA